MDHFFRNVYRGKTVMITGHTGFKGAWLSLWLNMLGARVIGYALEPDSEKSLFQTLRLGDVVEHHAGDIRNLEKLTEVMERHKPEIVFHMAAQPLVRESYASPSYTFETNIMGTVNLFEAVRVTGSVKVVVNVTTDKCYENQEWVHSYRENDPLGGHDPYSASKACSELITQSYLKSFFTDAGKTAVASARAGNVIGGGDWSADRIMPDCVRALLAGRQIQVRNPQAVRPWQFVLEPLSGYLWLGAKLWEEAGEFTGSWNFGPFATSYITVRQMVSKIIGHWGSGTFAEQETDGKAVHEANLLKLDCTKANHLLSWYPVYDVDETIEHTARWYAECRGSQEQIRSFTIGQIAGYADKAKELGYVWTKGG